MILWELRGGAINIYKNDLSGKRFTRWTVVEYSGKNSKNGTAIWVCKCDCGTVKEIPSTKLVAGESKSCGCLPKDRMAKLNYKHGGRKERLYRVWGSMKKRCEYERDIEYKNYGGRGIKVCEEFKDYEKFRNWAISAGYDPLAKKQYCTLDRIDVNGDYTPENCRWVPSSVQNNNRRNNKRITFNGETKTLAQWSKELGISSNLVGSRLKRGWSVEMALTVPPQTKYLGKNK